MIEEENLFVHVAFYSINDLPGHIKSCIDSTRFKKRGADLHIDSKSSNEGDVRSLWRCVSVFLEAKLRLKHFKGIQVQKPEVNEFVNRLEAIVEDASFPISELALLICFNKSLTLEELQDLEVIDEFEERFQKALFKSSKSSLILGFKLMLCLKEYELCDLISKAFDRLDDEADDIKVLKLLLMLFKRESDSTSTSAKDLSAQNQYVQNLGSNNKCKLIYEYTKVLFHKSLGDSSALMAVIDDCMPLLKEVDSSVLLFEKISALCLQADHTAALDLVRSAPDYTKWCFGQFIKVLVLLLSDETEDILAELQTLINDVNRVESRNFLFVTKIAKMLRSFCNNSSLGFEFGLKFIELAKTEAADVAVVQSELGVYYLLRGDHDKAIALFENLIEENPSSIVYLLQLSRCYLLSDRIEEAEAQLDLLGMISEDETKPEDAFLETLVKVLHAIKTAKMDEVPKLVKKKLRFLNGNTGPTTCESLQGEFISLSMNPFSMVEVLNQIIVLPLPLDDSDSFSLGITLARSILQYATSSYPCLQIVCSCTALLAWKTKSMSLLSLIPVKKQEALKQLLSGAHEESWQNTEPTTLLEEHFVLLLSQQKHIEAEDWENLRQGTNAILENSFEGTYESLAWKIFLTSEIAQSYVLSLIELGQHDSAQAFLTGFCEKHFVSTCERSSFKLLEVRMLLKQKHIRKALDLLKAEKPSSPHFLAFLQKRAEIYLTIRKDEERFIQCYQTFASEQKTLLGHNLLADAFLKIGRPSDALEVLQNALESFPMNVTIQKKITSVLTKTHRFSEAITNSQQSLGQYRLTSSSKAENVCSWLELGQHLVELLFALNKFSVIIKTVGAISDQMEAFDLSSQPFLKASIVLAKIKTHLGSAYKNLGSTKLFIKTIEEVESTCWAIQTNSSTLISNKQQLEINGMRSKVSLMLAGHYARSEGEIPKVIGCYKKCLEVEPSNVEAALGLGNLLLGEARFDEAEKVFSSFQNQSSQFFPDITHGLFKAMTAQRELDLARKLLEKVVDNDQNAFDLVIHRDFFQVLQASGESVKCGEFLKKICARSVISYTEENFLKGTYALGVGKTIEALTYFSRARQNPKLFWKSTKRLMFLYADFDSIDLELVLSQVSNTEEHSDGEVAERALQELLVELEATGVDSDSHSFLVLKSCTLLCSKRRTDLEQCLKDLVEIVQGFNSTSLSTTERITPFFFLSLCLSLLNQTGKAKNQLKRVLKQTTKSFSNEMVQSCALLLAKIYLQSASFNLAEELLLKITSVNKANFNAFELLGEIKGKEGSFKEALMFYSSAFSGCQPGKLTITKANIRVGLKLATLFMKVGNYGEALTISSAIQKCCPEMKTVKEDLLRPCEAMLRS